MIHLDKANDWPDATNGVPCCMGYAAYDHRRCTCWVPIYDVETQPHDGSTPGQRQSMCHDCAYRKGSPERQGVEGYKGSEDELEHIAATGTGPFFCHQGTAKTLQYNHPSGMVIQAHPADYHWVIVEKDGQRFPLKADGSAQDICAGYQATKKKYARQAIREIDLAPKSCRICGCTDDDCTGCIERTGQPCYWVEADLCSACASEEMQRG